MAKITFIILAHENAEHTADLARLLTEGEKPAHAVIHYDLKSPAHEFAKLKTAFAGSERVHIVNDRIKCGWGDFSLVDATVRSLKLIRKLKIDCERVMLVSGACMPIRPLAELSDYLDQHPKTEFIESFDSSWISGGLRHERWQYWHFFNFQTQHSWFRAHFNTQRKIWPKRRFPRGLEPRYGSQWWCLSWGLCEKILDYIVKHPLVYFFFSTTWIPDEMFFQTMAFRFTPQVNLASRNLTFFHFNDWGKPLVFLDDHIGIFKDVPFFFARKISSRATKLRSALAAIARSPAPAKPLKIDFKQRYTFPFKALLAAKLPATLPAASLFQHRDKAPWDEALDACGRSFAVLYGPPQLTRRAADALRQSAGLTVLGRIFRPGKIDFGPGREVFHGLHRDDNMIRDFDMAGYFRRILNRCEAMPIFELCPGDEPLVETNLLRSRNAIVLPIIPGDESAVMQQLYWILCSGAELPTDDHFGNEEDASPIMVFRSMLKTIERRNSRESIDRTELYLKSARTARLERRDQWAQALAFQHGSAAKPLIDGFDDIAAAVAGTKLEDMVSDMPQNWRNSLMKLSPISTDWQIPMLSSPVPVPDVPATLIQLQALAKLKTEKGKS